MERPLSGLKGGEPLYHLSVIRRFVISCSV